MNAESSKKNDKQQRVLALYGVLAGNQTIQAHTPETKPVLINELVLFANGLSGARDEFVSEQLGRDLNLRRQYRDVLSASSIDSFAKPRAAHSEGLFEKRIGMKGVVLKLKAAKSRAGQYYLIIEMPNHLSKPDGQSVVLNLFTNEQIERLVFPALHDGRTQIIISDSDKAFAMLQDHDLEIDVQ